MLTVAITADIGATPRFYYIETGGTLHDRATQTLGYSDNVRRGAHRTPGVVNRR